MTLDEVREQYVRGKESLRQISEDTGIALRKLQQRSAKEKWSQLRAAYRAEHAPEATRHEYGEILPLLNDLHMEYVAGNMSYRELADAHGINCNALRYHGAKDHWTEDRANHRAARMRANAADISDAAAECLYDSPSIELAIKESFSKKNAQYSYEKAMFDYVINGKSYARLGREYNIPDSALQSYSARHNWKAIRENYRRHKYATFLNADLAQARANAKRINSAISRLSCELDDAARRLHEKGAAMEELNEAWDVAAKAVKVNTNSAGQLTTDQLARIEAVFKKSELQAEAEKEKKKPQLVRFELSPELDELAR